MCSGSITIERWKHPDRSQSQPYRRRSKENKADYTEWEKKHDGFAHLMQRVPTLWNDVRFLARQPEAEAEGFEADGALIFVVGRVMAGNDGEGSGDHDGVRVGKAGVSARRTSTPSMNNVPAALFNASAAFKQHYPSPHVAAPKTPLRALDRIRQLCAPAQEQEHVQVRDPPTAFLSMRLCARSRLDSKHVAADNLDVALLVFHDTRDGQRPRIANAQFLWNVAQARFSAVPA
ncbi:predicted protein [Postia placenta Mad-698-R]|nr:predicted protein [Postia placenta Mad-698-R]